MLNTLYLDPFASSITTTAPPPPQLSTSQNNNVKNTRIPDAFASSRPVDNAIILNNNLKLEKKTNKYLEKPIVPSAPTFFEASFDESDFEKTTTTGTDFFAEFNSHFDKNKNDSTFIDAFGDNKFPSNATASTTQTNNFNANFSDVFNDNFEDEFTKIKISNNQNDNGKSKSKVVRSEDTSDFAKFDSFEYAFGGSSQNTKSSKPVSNNNLEKAGKSTERFAGDYSKGESFDHDLEAILQRSLVEQ